jgi:hypothetical protein
MQLLTNNGYTAEQIIARMTGPNRAWAFPVRLLDYRFNFSRYLQAGSISESSVTYDAESKPLSGVYQLSLRSEALDFDRFNSYLQPEVWVSMGTDKAGLTNDGDKFGKFRQWIFRITADPLDLGTANILRITAHDAISELLSGDQLTSLFVANEGDSVVARIIALLQSSPVPRWNITPSGEVFSKSRSWDPGTTLAAVLDGLCDEINYIRLPDEGGGLNIGPWRDPAVMTASIAYSDLPTDTLLREARVQRDVFAIPNHLTLLAAPRDDGTVWQAIEENMSAASPISQVNLKAPSGAPLVRHRVETGIEVSSIEILQDKATRRLLELSTVPETFDMKSRLKPYHQLGDVIEITRADAGYSAVRFQLKKMTFQFKHDGEQQMTLVRSISLR